MTIPASAIVAINPSVIDGGGSALVLNGVALTNNTAVPIGSVLPFSNPAAIANFFGSQSQEAIFGNVYFGGYDNSTLKPALLYFAQYNTVPVSAYLRGASLAAMTLPQLQALNGTLIVTVDGTVKTSSAINLTTATSFSNAATMIQAAFTGLGGTVTFDSQRQAFVFTSSTTGAASTIGYASGTLAAGLGLTVATGSILSQGAIPAVPATLMAQITTQTLNWATFGSIVEPSTSDALAFSAWTNASNKRFVFIQFDTDVTAQQFGNTTSWGAQIKALNSAGSVPIFGDMTHMAFVMGATASIDFSQTNGRITYAFKGQSGLASSIGDQTIANNLITNGYNFYGAYATANQNFTFFYPGLVSGSYSFLDEYVNQIWLNNALQLALVSLLQNVTSLPYNYQGYALIEAACLDPINAALNFGAIRTGVVLSAAQIAEVNSSAGQKIDNVLSTRGWYLQIKDPGAQVRAARQTPVIKCFYMDGGAVQQINMASIVVQ